MDRRSGKPASQLTREGINRICYCAVAIGAMPGVGVTALTKRPIRLSGLDPLHPRKIG
jgi:hypothetical protein